METEQESRKEQLKNLTVTIHRRPNCVVEFEIDANPELVKQGKEKALKKIAKDVSLPGFRKGKAPLSLIEKKYGKALQEELKKETASLCFTECQNHAQIPLLNANAPINYNVEEISLESGAKMKISFETEPQVPVVEFDKISFETVQKPEVTEEKVEKGLRQLMLIFAEWKKVEERGAQEGDFILIDLENIESEPAEIVMSNSRFEVTKEAMADWMLDLVKGMKSGESKEGISKPDEDASEKEKEEFKPTKVRLTLKTIEEAKLPELDDAFANKVGAKDVDFLKNHVKETLENQAVDFVRKQEREQIASGLVNTYDFDIPTSILQKETHFRLKGLLYEPQYLKDWKAMSEDERKKAVDEITDDARKAIRLFYLCRAVVRNANIAVTKEDVEKEMHQPFDPVKSKMGSQYEADKSEQEALALSKVMLAKAQDYILARLKNAASE